MKKETTLAIFNFVKKLKPESRRKDDHLGGVSHRKSVGIFGDLIWRDLNQKVFEEGSLTGYIYVNSVSSIVRVNHKRYK